MHQSSVSLVNLFRAHEEQEIRNRIEKAKNKRLLSKELEGKTLGDVDDSEKEFLSAADWIKRSRQQEGQKNTKSIIQRLQEEENEKLYTEQHLKGLAVMHDTAAFEEGNEVILTLQDSSILTRDEHGQIIGVNEEGDVLENIQISEAEKRAEREKQRKRLRQPLYAGYDDAEFEVSPLTKPSILPQYDAPKARGPKMVLGDEATTASSTSEVPMSVEQRVSMSLATESKLIDDYLTPTEYAAFNKPKKERKKRKIRKDTSFLDDIEAQQLAAGGSGDLGKREETNRNKAQEEEMRRREAYAAAQRAAEQKTAATRQAPVAPPASAIEDDDAEIAESLSRARRAALKQNHADPAQFVKEKVRSLPVKEERAVDPVLGDITTEDGRRPDGTIVFTSTTEFTSRLQARLQEREREKATIVARELDRTEESEDDEDMMELQDVSESKEEDEDLDTDILGQKPVGSGISATLALLKTTGELKKKEELLGRTKDTRDIDPSSADAGVKIEYRDEKGRKVTQKEAFRLLSYRFHGIKPGKKSQEKRAKVR